MNNYVLATAMVSSVGATAMAQVPLALDSELEPDCIEWSKVEVTFGAVPTPAANTTIGAVAKALVKEYWRSLGMGYSAGAKPYGLPGDLQAAQGVGVIYVSHKLGEVFATCSRATVLRDGMLVGAVDLARQARAGAGYDGVVAMLVDRAARGRGG